MASVRPATALDLDAIVRMGQAMHAESPRYRNKQFDPAKVLQLGVNMLAAPHTALFVAEARGRLVGMAAVVATDYWFGPDRYVTDLAIYVDPEHRGNGAFVRLVWAVEAWAREQGVQEISLGVSTDVEAERTVRAYTRMGYTLLPTRVVSKRLDTDHVHRT